MTNDTEVLVIPITSYGKTVEWRAETVDISGELLVFHSDESADHAKMGVMESANERAKELVQERSAKVIGDALDAIKEAHNKIHAVGRIVIPDYNPMFDHISEVWACGDSPIGWCVFHTNVEGQDTFCRYCGDPSERK